MRWTRAHQARIRDRRAGQKPVSDQTARRRMMRPSGRRSRVVLTPRRWRQGGGRHLCPTGLLEVLHSAGDGGKQARSPGRARSKPLKPLRAGTPGVPVCLRSIPVCFLQCTRGCGCSGHPAFPTPSDFGWKLRAELGRRASREGEGVSGMGCLKIESGISLAAHAGRIAERGRHQRTRHART
jgi:hypothetical protein